MTDEKDTAFSEWGEIFNAMDVETALAFADKWIDGVTVYNGMDGWRIVCAVLATEVRRQQNRWIKIMGPQPKKRRSSTKKQESKK